MNIIKTLIFAAIDKFTKAVSPNSSFQDSMKNFDAMSQTMSALNEARLEMMELIKNFSFKALLKFLFHLFSKTCHKGAEKASSTGNKAAKALDGIDKAANEAIEKIKKEMAKKIMKILMKILKVILKAILKVLQWLMTIIWPWLVIIIAVVALIYLLIMLLPSLTNLFSFSYGFNKADYYDTELFQAVKNKETMLENVYERTADTSFYQRFADSEIDDFLGLMVPNLEEEQTKYGKSYKEAAKDAQGGFTGFYTMDSRETAHDANFNPMQDVIQANTIDTSNSNKADMQGYFRDLFDKEENFALSEQFLRQANTYVQDLGVNYNNQLVYPEMFTKPIAYVTDFNRIDQFAVINEGKRNYVWKDYTYTTKRVTKDDVNNTLNNTVRNIRELDWANYYGSSVSGSTTLTADMEGKIVSWPSPYVWEYAVYKKDFYQLYDDGTNSSVYASRDNMVDNDYNSEYLTFVNDETGDVEQVKFFYKVLGASAENDWDTKLDRTKMDYDAGIGQIFASKFWQWISGSSDPLITATNIPVRSYGLLGDTEDYTFSEPYVGVLNSTFSDSASGEPTDFFTPVTEDGVWYVITIPDGYRLSSDISAKYTDENGVEQTRARTIDTIKVRKDFNPGPSVHIQTVQLTDDTGEIAVSSQNLINYKYYKQRTVTEAYRNEEAFVNGWGDYIEANEEVLGSFADKDLVTSISRRVVNVGKSAASGIMNLFSKKATDLSEGIDLDGESVDDEAGVTNGTAVFNIVMDYPPETLALALYLYEKDLVATTPEGENWDWNYSVNNYFRTDNDKLEGYEYYQKYYYLYEESELGGIFDEIADLVIDEYNSNKINLFGSYSVSNFKNQLKNAMENSGTISTMLTTEQNGEKILTAISDGFITAAFNPIGNLIEGAKQLYLYARNIEVTQEDLGDLLEKLSGQMHTAYVNLGSIRKTNEYGENVPGFASFIPNYNTITSNEKQTVIGKDIDDKDRGGEGSLLSTFSINEDIKNEALIYSARNKIESGTLVELADKPISIKFTNESEELKARWEELKQSWKDKVDLNEIIKRQTAVASNTERSIDFTAYAEDHEHYQYDYYIDTNVSETYRSGVYDNSGSGKENELPLEVQSVRDYGLASILNYVDSLTVEFYSGAWYDEIYLKHEIGEAVQIAYPEAYKTYSYTNDSYYTVSGTTIVADATKTTKSDVESATEIVGSGYYPKEMKEDASDVIVELFEQNNKKKLFEQLVNSIDGKIFEVQENYDVALWDSEKDNKLEVDNVKYDLTDPYSLDSELNSVSFDVDVVTDSMIGTTANFILKNETGNPIADNSSVNWADYQIYGIDTDSSGFYYYMPEIVYANTHGLPSKVAQLLIPKRYYRSWVKSVSLVDNNDDLEEDGIFVEEMSDLELLRTLVLKKKVEVNDNWVKFLKTYDNTLPASNLDAIKKGISDTLPYNIGDGAGSGYDWYAGKNSGSDLNPWAMSKKNEDTGRLSEDKGYINEEDVNHNTIKYYYTGKSFGNVTTSTTKPDKIYDYQGNEIATTGTSGEENYYSNLLEKYSSKNFKSGINRFDFITNDDVAKVFVIDEVATFTGKFMYTYKDTLLSTGDVLDFNNTKGVLSAYATDRYVFLDSWDIKLLTERVIDVSFMFMNVQPMVNGKTIPQFIEDENNSLKNNPSGILATIWAKIDSIIQGILEVFTDASRTQWAEDNFNDFYQNVYIYAVPSNYINEIKETSNWNEDSQMRKDVEAYTNLIFTGFLFQESSPAKARLEGDEKRDEWNKEYDLLHNNAEYKLDETAINAVSSAAADTSGIINKEAFNTNLNTFAAANGLSSGDIQAIKNEITALENANNFDELIDAMSLDTKLSDFMLSKKINIHIERDEMFDTYQDYLKNKVPEADAYACLKAQYLDFVNYCTVYIYENGEIFEGYPFNYIPETTSHGLFESAKNALSNLSGYILDAMNKAITGFKITSRNMSLCMTMDTTDFNNARKYNGTTNSGIDTYETLLTTYLTDIQNKYVKILGYKKEKTVTMSNAFDYDYELTLYNGDKQTGTGQASCRAFLLTYTLKCSDEIANKVEDGRYYSMFSDFQIGSITDINDSNDFKHLDDNMVFDGWKQRDLTSSEAYGELIMVNSGDLKPLFKSIYTDTVLTKNINGIDMKLDYDKLWQPEVKLFDNLDNTKYVSSTNKETLYGSYLSNSGINNNINLQDGVIDSSGKLKDYIKLNKLTNYSYKNNWFLRFLGNFTTDRKFLDATFDKSTADSLAGFGVMERYVPTLFNPDDDTKKEENLNDKALEVDLNDIVYAVNPIDILDEAGQKALLQKLNDEYGDQLKDILNQGAYAMDDGSTISDRHLESYAITGFVLVPRFSDRRDEPTLYPTYRYYGGSKKQIIPEEQVKYFEGLTYDSWKNKMTITEDSTDEDRLSFKDEMSRLSNYIYTYFSNFEAYVPYNITSDSDLEVRGTAGYADLLTQYTLYPIKTLEDTSLFVTEANKSYWNDLALSYNVPRSVIAQLLQGIAETRLESIGEDSLALIMKDNPSITFSSENLAIIESKLDIIMGYKKDESTNAWDNNEVFKVKLDGQDCTLPILGITAIDNLPDAELGEEPKETEVAAKSLTDVVFIGGVSSEAEAKFNGAFASIINSPDALSQTLLSRVNEIPTDAKFVALMPSVQDVITSRDAVGNVDSIYVRNLLKAITKRAPEATVYYFPVLPVVAGLDNSGNSYYTPPSPWEGADILNNAIISFNDKIKNFCNSNLDGKVIYKDTPEGVLDDGTGGLKNVCANSSKISLGSYGAGIYLNEIRNIVESEGDIILGTKDTRYFAPTSKNLEDFEISLNITETKTDERLCKEDAVAYMSLKLYKSSKSLGDLLKGVYATFYGDKFVKALVSVTDDTALNLAIDGQHGVWYRPTDNDITRALDKLSESTRKLFDWRMNIEHDKLTDIYGIRKLQNSFSYIKNQDYRKTLVTFAMNSNGGFGNISGITVSDLEWDIGTQADAVVPAAEQIIQGKSLINGNYVQGVRMIDYIATVCNEFSTEDNPLDPAIIMALIFHESHGDPNIKQYGGGAGRGLAQHSVPDGLNASAKTNSGSDVSVHFPYADAFNPIASIDYTVINMAGKLQSAGYQMHMFTAVKTHNLPTTATVRQEAQFLSKYPLTPEGDLKYIYEYETGANYEGYITTMRKSSGAERAARISEAEYRTNIPAGENYGYSDPIYITHILAYYNEDYANGDLLNSSLSASNKRDYSEELWEEEYLKYQNSGVELITSSLAKDDIDQLVQMTANYRNNNDVQNEYGYTYLDFFRNINDVDSGENKFTGEMGDSLILNAMTYLGAHYSQGLSTRPQDVANGILYLRTSHGENLGGSTYNTPWGQIYGEGTFGGGGKWAFDCSSFGNQMYLAMGYNLNAGTCAALRSKYMSDSEVYLGNASSVGLANLQPGDLLVSSTHTIIWMNQSYTTNYGDLFDPTTLRIVGNQIIKRSGSEVLSYANSNVSQNAYIHCGGYKGGGSCVNIKEGKASYFSGFAVFRFFRDDLDYNRDALSSASEALCPTIFTSTTIKNNPYLVKYMEDSGILNEELAKGGFTNEDVISAKNKLASIDGTGIEPTDEELSIEEQVGVSLKDTGYYTP